MKSNYQEAWEAMNKLQEHSSKLNTIKDLIETAVKYTDDENVISLLEATENMISIYVDEFDDLFRAAWDKTIKPVYTDRVVRFNDAISDIDTANDGVLLKQDREIKNKINKSWVQFLGD